MPTQSEALRLMLEAITSMRQSGYTSEDILGLAGDALEHLQPGGHQPHSFGRCINCGRIIIGRSAYRGPPWSASPARGAASPSNFHRYSQLRAFLDHHF